MKTKLGYFTIELVAVVLVIDGLIDPPAELCYLCINSIKTILSKYIDYLDSSNDSAIC